jgi:HEAT repeat protein
LEQMAGVVDAETASALVRLLCDAQAEETRKLVTHLLGVIPNAIAPLGEMLKHPDEEAQVTAATILEHLLDPRSAEALIDAMGSPAVRDIAVRTLKKLGAIRERIDRAFNALRDVEGATQRGNSHRVFARRGLGGARSGG